MTSSDWEHAERSYAGYSVDLVVVDHGIQRVTGAEVAKRLKSIRPVYVLMLTGNTEISIAPPSVDVLLHKPVVPEDLLATIARIFGARTDSAIV